MRPPPSSTLVPCTTLFRSRLLPGPARPGLLFLPKLVARLAPYGAPPRRLPARPVATVRPAESNSKRSAPAIGAASTRSEEHTSELQSHVNPVCRLLLQQKN